MGIINPKRTCPECGERFIAHHGRQRFCKPAHKSAFSARNRERGKMIVPLLQVWRTGRNRANGGAGKYAFSNICALIDLWNEEDRKAGRRPEVQVRDRISSGWTAVDSLDRRTF